MTTFMTDYKPSRLTLGTVQFGLDYGIANRGGKPGFRTVCDILTCARESGVNCLDTAARYGSSEEVLGNALHETGLAGEMVVVTKVAPVPDELATGEISAFIRNSVETSLRKLKLETIPLCLFHRESDYKYIDELAELHGKNLIHYFGVSADNNPGPAKEMADDNMISALQLPMNILDTRHEKSGVLETADSRRLTIFVRSVYLQGLLLMPEQNIMPELKDVIPARRALEKTAETTAMGMDELSFRYILSLKGVSSVITGVETLPQIKRNVELMNLGPLPQDLMDAVRKTVAPLPEHLLTPKNWPNAWTGKGGK